MTGLISLKAVAIVVFSAIGRNGPCTWFKWSPFHFMIQLGPPSFLGGALGFSAGVKLLTDLASHLCYFSVTAALNGLFNKTLGVWIYFVQFPGTTTPSTSNAFTLSLTEWGNMTAAWLAWQGWSALKQWLLLSSVPSVEMVHVHDLNDLLFISWSNWAHRPFLEVL